MVYRFHDYTLDPASREVRHGARRLALEPKVFQVLLYLLEHRDRMVPKAELLEQCWPETFVSESALTRCLARLRKAVQPTSTALPVIETRHRQGYRFVAAVTMLTHAPPAPGDTAPLQAATPVVPPVSSDSPEPPTPRHSAPLSTSSTRPTVPEAERRQLTVLFCDVVDSTTLAGQLDPEDYRDIMGRYHATCTAAIQRYGGHVAQYLGDGLLVYFGWPQAHEDDARRAVHAGLALVTSVRELGSELVQDFGLRLAVRIGMHTGLVVVGTGAEDIPYGQLAVGATPNLAAKIQALAAPDTVMISAATYALVQGYFDCASQGAHTLPGMTEPSVLYQVRQASGAHGRLDVTPLQQRTPFVGREAELAMLRERAAQVQQGLGQVVLLSGEAGMGKSRLLQEVTTACTADGFQVTDWRCSPYAQQTALYPVVKWLQRTLHFVGDTPMPERLERLERLLHQARLDLPESLPLLAALLSLDLPEALSPALQLTPQQQRQRTLETLVALLLAHAERQPVLFVVEDLHWMDPTTLEWLGMLVAQGPTAPLFTVLTCRPTFVSPWSGRTHVTLLTLPPLAAPQVTQMVAWLGGHQLSPAQRQRIVTQTDGVPLFVEEVTKFVLAAQRLQGSTGWHTSERTAQEIAIPETLRDSLMARLDQLGPVKGTAQLGATIGREFPYVLLQAVTPLEEDVLRQDLKQLVEVELLYQRGVGATAVYQFKHALIQDAAYQSLLKSTRQQYHQRIAQVLAERFPETAEMQPALLAQHYTAAGLHAQALPCWQRAGQHALERSAHREAVASLEQGLEAVSHLPHNHTTLEQAIDLRLALRSALNVGNVSGSDFERTLIYLREAEALAVTLDDPHRLAEVLLFLSRHFSFMGAHDQAITAAQRVLTLVSVSGDIALRARANQRLGMIALCQGNYHRAIDCLGQTVAFLDGAQRHERFGTSTVFAASSCAWLAWGHAELGTFPEGRALGDEGLQIAEAVNHPASLLVALWGSGLLALRKGNLPRALVLLERAMSICQDTDLPTFFSRIAAALGSAYALAGRVADAVALLPHTVEQAMTTEPVEFQALYSLTSGETQLLSDHLEAAHAFAEGALALACRYQERGHQAYALRLLGDIAARCEPPESDQAETHYRHALALAGELGMRPLQAHCHHSLGTLYNQTGRAALARGALSTAIAMYRAMDMTFWLPQAEAALAQRKEP
jgi:class 3 adenylate cyclase/DNA-binding winged helix-turn-helix (wHTH) protein/tetratricopeptide (TPR) repeat protein